jgi:hypothetical protein
VHLQSICFALAVLLQRRALAFAGDFPRLAQLDGGSFLYPWFATLGIPEERREHFADARPVSRLDLGDAGKRVLVGRQRAGLPLMHDQMQIRAALKRAEMRGVRKVVGDVERHPRLAAHALFACAGRYARAL